MNLYVGALLVWVIVFPSLFSWIAPFIYLGFLWLIILRPKKLNATLDARILFGFTSFIVLGFILLLINVILFGDYSPWTYWVVGYSTWGFFLILLRSVGDPASLVHGVLTFTGFVAAVGSLIYIVLFLTGVVTESISIPGYQAYFGIDERGFFAFSTSHLPLIAFFIPYFTIKAAKSSTGLLRKEQLLMVLLVVSGLLSLRSIIWLVIFTSFIYYCISTGKIKFFIKTILLVLITLGLLAVSFGFGYESIMGIYELKWMGKVTGEDVRFQQLIFWINSFLDSPLIGHGLTSVEMIIYDIATGDLVFSNPGSIVAHFGYEILYAKLLSDIGMIFFVYVFLFSRLTFFSNTTSSLQWQVSALRFSALCMVVQSATNSYLQTSGWLFTLMLPMIFIASNNTFFTKLIVLRHKNYGKYNHN